MRSARSGWLRGNTSASIEARRAFGASGYCPSTAWLPITTISRSSAIAPAARITCSSSERVMHAPALGLVAQLGRPRRDFPPRPLEQRFPLEQRCGRLLAVALQPAEYRLPRALDQTGIGADPACNQRVQREI